MLIKFVQYMREGRSMRIAYVLFRDGMSVFVAAIEGVPDLAYSAFVGFVEFTGEYRPVGEIRLSADKSFCQLYLVKQCLRATCPRPQLTATFTSDHNLRSPGRDFRTGTSMSNPV